MVGSSGMRGAAPDIWQVLQVGASRVLRTSIAVSIPWVMLSWMAVFLTWLVLIASLRGPSTYRDALPDLLGKGILWCLLTEGLTWIGSWAISVGASPRRMFATWLMTGLVIGASCIECLALAADRQGSGAWITLGPGLLAVLIVKRRLKGAVQMALLLERSWHWPCAEPPAERWLPRPLPRALIERVEILHEVCPDLVVEPRPEDLAQLGVRWPCSRAQLEAAFRRCRKNLRLRSDHRGSGPFQRSLTNLGQAYQRIEEAIAVGERAVFRPDAVDGHKLWADAVSSEQRELALEVLRHQDPIRALRIERTLSPPPPVHVAPTPASLPVQISPLGRAVEDPDEVAASPVGDRSDVSALADEDSSVGFWDAVGASRRSIVWAHLRLIMVWLGLTWMLGGLSMVVVMMVRSDVTLSDLGLAWSNVVLFVITTTAVGTSAETISALLWWPVYALLPRGWFTGGWVLLGSILPWVIIANILDGRLLDGEAPIFPVVSIVMVLAAGLKLLLTGTVCHALLYQVGWCWPRRAPAREFWQPRSVPADLLAEVFFHRVQRLTRSLTPPADLLQRVGVGWPCTREELTEAALARRQEWQDALSSKRSPDALRARQDLATSVRRLEKAVLALERALDKVGVPDSVRMWTEAEDEDTRNLAMAMMRYQDPVRATRLEAGLMGTHMSRS